MKVLVVINQFENFVKGEIIKAKDKIEEILAGHAAHNVVVTEAPDDKSPAPAAK